MVEFIKVLFLQYILSRMQGQIDIESLYFLFPQVKPINLLTGLPYLLSIPSFTPKS